MTLVSIALSSVAVATATMNGGRVAVGMNSEGVAATTTVWLTKCRFLIVVAATSLATYECPKTLITNPGFSKIRDQFHIYDRVLITF